MWGMLVLVTLPALPTMIALTYSLKATDQRLGLSGGLIGVLLAVSPIATYFVWQIDEVWAIAYLVVTWVAAFQFIGWLQRGGTGSLAAVAVLLAWLVAVATAVPFAVLPYYRVDLDTALRSTPSPKVELSSIQDSVTRLETAVSGMSRDIQREQIALRSATADLLRELDHRATLVRQLEKQRDELARQVVEQQALASLTHNQAEAVRRDLARDKYFEYLVGFVIGIASSIVASMIGKFLGQEWAA
jgi:hypothetical protein